MAIDKARIDRWEAEGIITAAQGARLKADLLAHTAGASSGMLIVAAMLNGAVLYLFTRVYGVDIAIHAILLLWLVCVLPLAYATRSRGVSFASGLLFCAWFAAFAFRDLSVFATLDRWAWLSPMVLLGGVTAFSLGGLHYLVPGFDGVARGIRIAGLQAAIVALFTMTFDLVAEGASFFNELRDLDASTQIAVVSVAFGIVALAATLLGQLLPRAKARVTRVEGPVNATLVATAIVFVMVPIPARTSAVLASVVLFSLVAAVIVVGSRRRDRRLLRIGGLAMTLFLALRICGALWAKQGIPVAVASAAGLVALGFFATSFLVGRLKPATRPST